jgi:hypothetical protein
MNEDEMKSLENRLHSWRPRRPSATLKWRLAIASGNFLPKAARFAGVLVPATACVLLAVLNLNSEARFTGGAPASPVIPMALSNQNYTTYYEGLLAGKGENCPPSQIFKWTNGGASTSSMRFTSF